MRMDDRPTLPQRSRVSRAAMALVGVMLVATVLLASWAPTSSVAPPAVATPSGSYGSVAVGPAVASQPATALWRLNITEAGLPSGTSWYATANGTTKHTTVAEITFQVPNGTYQWSITNVSGYTVAPASGSAQVQGANVTVSVVFTATTHDTIWRLRVTEVGLPSGTSWYATANGTTKHTTASLITFQVPNGTYQWSIINVSGFTVDPAGGSVTVHNANVTVSVTFTSTSHDGGGLLSKYWWALAAGGVLLLLIIAVLVIRWRRRQSPPAAEWTPPAPPGSEPSPPPPEGAEPPYAEGPPAPPTSGPSP